MNSLQDHVGGHLAEQVEFAAQSPAAEAKVPLATEIEQLGTRKKVPVGTS
jgi:hypothetical protein